MGRIKILDEKVSNIIAAGEVVENPASMIKELLENSLDAGASSIRIDVKNSGRNVTISDNGCGMSKEDLFLSIERHATSKIFNKEDIFALTTYGFRGEALASIASVSKLRLSSKRAEDIAGCMLTASGGKITSHSEKGMNTGTEIEVSDLFFNTPARLKFLRKKGTEYAKIKEIVLKESLVSPDVSFSLMIDGREVIKTGGRGIKNTILELFNRNVLKNLVEFPFGFLGNLEITRSSKDHIYTYVNGRYVKSAIIEKAVLDGYYTQLTKGRYPFGIIFLEVDPSEIDVNVHPSKKIVKFSNGNLIYDLVFEEVKKAIDGREEIVSPKLEISENFNQTIDLTEFGDILGLEDSAPLKKIEDSSVTINNKVDREIDKVSEVKEEVKEYNKPFEKDDKPLKAEPIKTFKNEVIKTRELPLVDDSEKEAYSRSSFEEMKEEKKSYFEKNEVVNRDYRVIGQFYNSYIIVERNSTLEVYDQHIVQERVLYEKLKEQHYSKSIGKQGMLVPLKLSVDFQEKNIIDEHRELLDEFGFEVEDFDDREILIRSVPVFDFRSSIENTFRYMLEKLRSDERVKDFRERIIISMSCRNAIKAGEPLNIEEMNLLIDELFKVGKFTCPHGRPIIVKLPLEELEKKFKRR